MSSPRRRSQTRNRGVTEGGGVCQNMARHAGGELHSCGVIARGHEDGVP